MKPAFVFLALATLLVFGCGGSSDPVADPGGTTGTDGITGTGGTTGSGSSGVFDGTWTGSYTQPSASPTYQGTMRLVIIGFTITGTVHDATYGDGTVAGTIGYRDYTPLSIRFSPTSGVSPLGYLKLDARGHLIGLVPTTLDQDSRPPEIDFDLAPVTSP